MTPATSDQGLKLALMLADRELGDVQAWLEGAYHHDWCPANRHMQGTCACGVLDAEARVTRVRENLQRIIWRVP